MSLRLMNFCGVFCAKHRSDFEADESFKTRLWQSIYCQTEWLMGHLETHLMITNPRKYFDDYIDAGSDTLIFLYRLRH